MREPRRRMVEPVLAPAQDALAVYGKLAAYVATENTELANEIQGIDLEATLRDLSDPALVAFAAMALTAIGSAQAEATRRLPAA